MTYPRQFRVLLGGVLSVVALFACVSARGETVYKYRMPDGRVIYSDKPVPGGELESELQPPPQPEPSVAPEPSSQPSDVDKRIAARRDALERARRELDAANAALAEAQRRLEAGREPLPEEFTALATRGTRLSEKYERRQAANERAVAQAKTRVKRAEEELNRVRY
jgi:hypothetical protein